MRCPGLALAETCNGTKPNAWLAGPASGKLFDRWQCGAIDLPHYCCAPPAAGAPLSDGWLALRYAWRGPRQGLEADSICGTWAVEWFQRLCQTSWEEWQAGMQVRLSLLPRAQLPGLVIPSDAGGGD